MNRRAQRTSPPYRWTHQGNHNVQNKLTTKQEETCKIDTRRKHGCQICSKNSTIVMDTTDEIWDVPQVQKLLMVK
jgi:hypothetical protein